MSDAENLGACTGVLNALGRVVLAALVFDGVVAGFATGAVLVVLGEPANTKSSSFDGRVFFKGFAIGFGGLGTSAVAVTESSITLRLSLTCLNFSRST